jgi:hypothetical protein
MVDSGLENGMSERVELAAAVARVKALPHFAISHWWLTFYLAGAPEDLSLAASRLRDLGAQVIDDGDFAFLYPKLLVTSELQAIENAISSVRLVADMARVKLVGLDADVGLEPGASKFARLLEL